MRRWIRYAAFLVPLIACTDAGLYATNDRGPSSPDRVEFEGDVCVPLASGDAFPVRVLYAFPAGANVSTELKTNLGAAIDAAESRFSFPYIKFSVIEYHT